MLLAVQHDVTASVQSLAWILGTACPIVVAIVMKASAPAWLKAVLNAALATVAGLLAVAIKANGHLDPVAWMLAIGNSMIVAFAVYAGFLKHTVTRAIDNSALGNVGIGPSSNGPVNG